MADDVHLEGARPNGCSLIATCRVQSHGCLVGVTLSTLRVGAQFVFPTGIPVTGVRLPCSFVHPRIFCAIFDILMEGPLRISSVLVDQMSCSLLRIQIYCSCAASGFTLLSLDRPALHTFPPTPTGYLLNSSATPSAICEISNTCSLSFDWAPCAGFRDRICDLLGSISPVLWNCGLQCCYDMFLLFCWVGA